MDKNKSHTVLIARNLAIGYHHRKEKLLVSKKLNLDLKSGSLVCLLGKNGIGKSTLLRTLMKVQPQLEGKIQLQGQDLERISPVELSKLISLVLTERIPESNLTAYELIALGRQPYTNWLGSLTPEDKLQIDKAINETNIEKIVHKKHDALSDGQLQKVMIARALAQNTEIIALDEPTAHLDIHNKIEIFKLLKKLAAELKKTVLISSHEVHLALQLADELWLMDQKGIISGPAQKLIARGELQKLFSSKLVTFDSKSQQFIVKEP